MTNTTTFTIDSALHWPLRDAALYGYEMAIKSVGEELSRYRNLYDNYDLDDGDGWREQIEQQWGELKHTRQRLVDIDYALEVLGSARVAGMDEVVTISHEGAEGLYHVVEYGQINARARIEDQVPIGADLDPEDIRDDADLLVQFATLREEIKRAMKRPEPRPGVPPVCEIPDELRDLLRDSADDLIGYNCSHINDDLLRDGAVHARDELRRYLPALEALDAGERWLPAADVVALADNAARDESNALGEVDAVEEPAEARTHLDTIDALSALSKHAEVLVDNYEQAKEARQPPPDAVERAFGCLVPDDDEAPPYADKIAAAVKSVTIEPRAISFAETLSPDERYAAAFALVEEAQSIASGLIDQHKEFINAGTGNWQHPVQNLTGFARGLANLVPSLAAVSGADISPEFGDEPEDVDDLADIDEGDIDDAVWAKLAAMVKECLRLEMTQDARKALERIETAYRRAAGLSARTVDAEPEPEAVDDATAKVLAWEARVERDLAEFIRGRLTGPRPGQSQVAADLHKWADHLDKDARSRGLVPDQEDAVPS